MKFQSRRIAAGVSLVLAISTLLPVSAASARGGGGLNLFFYGGTSTGSGVVAPAKNCLKVSATDLNFNWGTGGPGGTCPGADFYGYASGGLIAPFNGTLYFCSVNDDGLRVKVGATTIIDSWDEQGPNTSCNAKGSMSVTAGTIYPLTLWYYNHLGGAVLTLKWASAEGEDAGDYNTIPWANFVPNAPK